MKQRALWVLNNASVRTLLCGGAAAATAVWNRPMKKEERNSSAEFGDTTAGLDQIWPLRRISPTFLSPSVSLAQAASHDIGTYNRSCAEGRPQTGGMLPKMAIAGPTARKKKRLRKVDVYDFIVIGYGNVGKSAVETLQRQCPTATVALLDPLRRPHQSALNGQPTSSSTVDYFQARAIGLSPTEQCLQLDDDDCSTLSYRHAVLVASGARGAPPPSYLLDENARSRIFELRSTTLPCSNGASGSGNDGQHRSVLSPEEVRREVLRRAKAGAAVAVLGCGWDALDLAVSAASADGANKDRVTLIFGSHGPLSHVLPNYLSAAVSKRLRARRIAVLNRSLVRYFACHDRGSEPMIKVYSAKSSDVLEGKTSLVDCVVIAPEVHGPRGTGALPTDEIPDFLDESSKGRSWYQTWAGLSVQSSDDPAFVVCYKDDGRIAVNAELRVCRGVYAAGSVAKCANGRTGHAVVAGTGVEDGSEAGRVVATNMARHYKRSTATPAYFGFSSACDTGSVANLVMDPLPVWRSDLRSTAVTDKDRTSSLADVGITMLCVGNCDSECLSTHGVWWTNQSVQKRLLGVVDDFSDVEQENILSQQKQRKRVKQALKAVYGLGIVYYLDRTGRIQGVATWGLPFHRDHNLNQRLVEQMKHVIKTNGGLRSLETDIDRVKMAQYLVEASKGMVMTAFGSQTDDAGMLHQLDGALESLPRPLHRFTEARPPNIRSVGVLRRREGLGQGVLGEDLFARFENDDTPDVPVPRPHPTANVGSATAKVEARYEWNVWEQSERRWAENDSRARPPKEEPLWIRKGDEARNIPQSELIAAAYSTLLKTKRHGT